MDQGAEWYSETTARAGGLGRDEAFLPGGSNGGAVKDPTTRIRRAVDPNAAARLGLRELERLAERIGVQADHAICQDGKRFYADYAEARKAAGRSVRETERSPAAASALYFGAKSTGYARSIKEIASNCDVPLGECMELLKNFKVVLGDKPYAQALFRTVCARDLLTRALGGIAFETRDHRNVVFRAANRLFDRVADQGALEGRTPETVCGAVVYRACDENNMKISKKVVYTACGISNVTLNKCLTQLKAVV
jgi:transcription initiation factor TFIIIB Brf1 subunit/transcription initiation factor TFIIB